MNFIQSPLGIALVSGLVGVIGGWIGWLVKAHAESLRREREKLSDERRRVYGDILDPFIQVFASIKGNREKSVQKAIEQITSFDYRKTSFDFSLYGEDKPVEAYNNLMQFIFSLDENSQGRLEQVEVIRLWGQLLLELRKSLGNPKTKLNEWDMLKSMISDIDSIADESVNQ